MRYNGTSGNIEQQADRQAVNRSIQVIGHDWPEKDVRNYNTQVMTTPVGLQRYESDEDGDVKLGAGSTPQVRGRGRSPNQPKQKVPQIF